MSSDSDRNVGLSPSTVKAIGMHDHSEIERLPPPDVRAIVLLDNGAESDDERTLADRTAGFRRIASA